MEYNIEWILRILDNWRNVSYFIYFIIFIVSIIIIYIIMDKLSSILSELTSILDEIKKINDANKKTYNPNINSDYYIRTLKDPYIIECYTAFCQNITEKDSKMFTYDQFSDFMYSRFDININQRIDNEEDFNKYLSTIKLIEQDYIFNACECRKLNTNRYILFGLKDYKKYIYWVKYKDYIRECESYENFLDKKGGYYDF